MKPIHQPVLPSHVIQALRPQRGEVYLDCTAGFGGHAALVEAAIGAEGRMMLVDRDAHAIQALAERFGERADLIHSSFLEASQRLSQEGLLVDMILLDLGVSSPQFDNAERGFSFRADVPLDMRMDRSQSRTAADIVNHTGIQQLERLIRDYGEEPRARAVARAIISARPLTTTGQLARVVRGAAVHTTEIDSATRTFQAIRIAVNEELDQLRDALPLLIGLLKPQGRIAVISFHSLEDRIVKQFFETESRDCICPPKQPICTCDHRASLEILTKKPLTADSSEIAINPRARSAKLRAAEKKHQNKRRD